MTRTISSPPATSSAPAPTHLQLKQSGEERGRQLQLLAVLLVHISEQEQHQLLQVGIRVVGHGAGEMGGAGRAHWWIRKLSSPWLLLLHVNKSFVSGRSWKGNERKPSQYFHGKFGSYRLEVLLIVTCCCCYFPVSLLLVVEVFLIVAYCCCY